MIRICTIILVGILVSGCSMQNEHNIASHEYTGGCVHDEKLSPLKLDQDDKKILAARTNPPRTAADYYFALPSSYFSIMESTPERRATYIKKNTLSRNYLHATRSFECNGGGFEITIRVFDGASGPLIGVLSSTYNPVVIMSKHDPAPGELESISLFRPRFWRYVKGAWDHVDDSIMPQPTKHFVIYQYHNRYKAHLKYTDQTKFIELQYELPVSGNYVRVWGRENFMDSAPTWTTYHFNGIRFVP